MNDHVIGLALACMWRAAPLVIWACRNLPAIIDRLFWHEIEDAIG